MDESGTNLEFGEAAERGMLLGLTVTNGLKNTRGAAPRQPLSCGWTDKYPNLLTVSLFFLGFIQGCAQGGPEAIADRFMESYYAAANLADALQVADGLAARKIQDQQLLLRGQGGPPPMQGRRVSYTRTEKATVEGKLFFRYEVQIDVQGGGSFARKSLLALSQGPKGWRVTNFSESD